MKVFKVWARFDPCATPQMLFTLGLDSYTYTIEIPANIDFDGMLFSQSFCVRITNKYTCIYMYIAWLLFFYFILYLCLIQGYEGELKSGNKLDILGGLDLTIR